MRTDALGCIATALGRVAAVAAFLPGRAACGREQRGRRLVARSRSWPLIAVHAVLMPDGRVLTYGTDRDRPADRHLHLRRLGPSAAASTPATRRCPTRTGTDIFCSSQVRAAVRAARSSSPAATTGPARARRTPATTTATVFAYGSNTLTRDERHEPRALVLVLDHAAERRDLHPGRRRRHRPSRDPRHRRRVPPAVRREHRARSTSCTRATSSRRTAASSATTAPAACTTSTPRGIGARCDGRTVQRADRQRLERRDVPARAGSCSSAATRAARWSSTSTARRRRSRPTQPLSSQRRLVNATILADGKVLATGGSDVWNELTGVNYSAEIWNPTTGQWTRGADRARARGSTTRRAVLLPDASVLVARRRRAGPAEQHQRRGLLPALPLRRGRRLRGAPGDRRRAGHDRHRRDLRRRARQHRRRSAASSMVKTTSAYAQLQHGPAVRRADLPAERRPPASCRRRRAPPTRRPGSTCCSCSTPRARRRSRRSCASGVAA